MSLEVYRVVHIAAILACFASLGGITVCAANGISKQNNPWRKQLAITHGVSLLLLLVSGFGMLARLGIHTIPLWVIAKLLVWLALGGIIAVAYRGKASVAWWGMLTLGAVAATIGIYWSTW